MVHCTAADDLGSVGFEKVEQSNTTLEEHHRAPPTQGIAGTKGGPKLVQPH